MLTRDIALEDAILDLLDNCVDGIHRLHPDSLNDPRPYAQYWAKISFDEIGFTIEDNCGGISRDLAEKSAFMLGRPDEGDDAPEIPTLGIYGIGMKRAIFKLGRSATVTSRTPDEAFVVTISPAWMEDDKDWELPLQQLPRSSTKPTGTKIVVTELVDPTRAAFTGAQDFAETFIAKVATHYSFIIHKGFSVTVNGTHIKPVPLKFLYARAGKTGMAPFVYEAEIDGVSVRLMVGFYKGIPTADELDEEADIRRSKENAGWTIICNDRVVLYCDKTRLTGWGEANVPGFHSQFNAINGFVEFRSNDAWKLPITTTKRGVDAGAEVYLFVKEYMREGMKEFTGYTYKWKHDPQTEKANVRDAKTLDVTAVMGKIGNNEWTKITKNKGKTERKFVPALPVPTKATTDRFLRFSKPVSQIRKVSNFIFEENDRPPSEVGSAAFDWVLKQSKST